MRIGLAIHPDTNDLFFEAGSLAVVTEAKAVAQHARQRLMTHEGEWFLDTRVGVPWLSDILGRAYDQVLAEAVVKGCLLDTDGVTGIETFSVSFDRAIRRLRTRGITVTTDYDQRVKING